MKKYIYCFLLANALAFPCPSASKVAGLELNLRLDFQKLFTGSSDAIVEIRRIFKEYPDAKFLNLGIADKSGLRQQVIAFLQNKSDLGSGVPLEVGKTSDSQSRPESLLSPPPQKKGDVSVELKVRLDLHGNKSVQPLQIVVVRKEFLRHAERPFRGFFGGEYFFDTGKEFILSNEKFEYRYGNPETFPFLIFGVFDSQDQLIDIVVTGDTPSLWFDYLKYGADFKLRFIGG